MRVAVFGDSIANGLGVRGPRYADLVTEALGAELLDFTASAQTVAVSEARLRASGVDGIDLAIIAHGTTEAILRPSQRTLRCVPARWRRTGWLDPRPYFSTSRHRRLAQRLESEARWRVKVGLLKWGTAEQLLALPAFVDHMVGLQDALRARGAHVVILGPTDLDDRYFPGSSAALREYASGSRSVARSYVPMNGALQRWDHYCLDHFHPNEAGHRAMAERITAALP
ncbi:SGNH/GDSL hydrolase family protein [Nocardioides sp. ChNu-153]|uniref:SGNH/GDSL hydrolase family protein n=1 Tax=unclassified Nocardioides TaxID=2615069 RepID=UPI002404C637|nr:MULTISPECIES: GDSL-type esterase/lipase family protein [unclassified Nocardioides]MDF9715015.1 hypothetical protein [Nocardioides sp. ChNu-99]MDN7122284.1 SGNH/GDSL hydrolase family protein [Nocardioides sp. ChNu-153]